MMPPSKPAPGSQRLLAGLLIVLAAWGIYLAIGATGIFTDVGLFDARRSAIVLACSAAFLGFWLGILRRPSATGRSDSADAGPPRNRASLASVGVIAAAYLLWVAAWVAWSRGNPANLTFVVGWLSTAGFAIAAILALIGLSDPARERGKLWGLLTLALLLLAAGAFVAQVRHFTAARDTTPPDIASPNR